MTAAKPDPAARKQALAVLKTLLANPELAAGPDGCSAVDGAFVKRALAALSAEEAVQLLDWRDVARDAAAIPWCAADPEYSCIRL